MHDWSEQLQAWRDYYVFGGTAAATLMGLMFVVMSLGQRSLATDEGARATRGFFTPIVVFFATVIVITMLVLIPKASSLALSLLLGIIAICGGVYMVGSGAHSMWRAGELGFDDLIWYVVLPYLGYTGIAVAAIAFWKATALGFMALAVAMLLLLLTGVRNAWDLVVYNIQKQRDG